jgi:hypothetical protein
MGNNFNQPEELMQDAVWAARALETAQRLGQPDLISAAYDASGAVEIGRDEMRRVVELAEERHAFEDRVSTGERADAWIVQTWGQFVLGDLAAAAESAERARAGLAQGQASAFVLGATAWRVLALHALGRWDEALVEAAHAERAWQESELKAPLYALSGFLAALAIARGRGDSIGADRWQGVIARIQERSDAMVRTRRLMAYVDDDLPALVRDVVADFRIFAGRQDSTHLALGLLADRRHPVESAVLDDLLDYAGARGLGLITAGTLRLRGVLTGSRPDLETALGLFESMGAIPSVARVRTELGIVGGDATLVDAGLDALDRLGDVEQASRVGAERKTASLSRA